MSTSLRSTYKIAFLVEASAKALTPLPQSQRLADARFYASLFLLVKIYMFLEQEKSEFDDFEEKLWFKRKHIFSY